ncbi:MAG TPA: hypothetical protein VIG99_29975 [Myxococcaceae bacterium]
MRTLWKVWPALLIVGCASSAKRAAPALEDALWPSAELLCRHSVFEQKSLGDARHDAALSAMVMPAELNAIPPCEGDLGEVSKCTQEYWGVRLRRAVAPHVRCERVAVERRGDWVEFTVRKTAPVVPWSQSMEALQGKLDFKAFPTRTTEHMLRFGRYGNEWRAMFSDQAR